MTIQLAEVPPGVRTPFTFIEIDASKAQTGPSIQNYRTLQIGQRLSTGTVPADEPFLATSADQVGAAAGRGSILHQMAIAYFRANNVTEAWFIGVSDAAGTAATQTLTVTGPATSAGTIFLYIAGRQIQVAVANGDADTVIAAAIDAAIDASDFATELPVVPSTVDEVVTLTARNLGTEGNAIDVRLNYNQGEALPAGVGVTIAAGVTGATDPTITAAITAMSDVKYHTIALGMNNVTAIAALEAELADRFTAPRQIAGHAFYGLRDTHANLITAGGLRNSPHVSLLGMDAPLASPWEWAASTMGLAARSGQNDPAQPFQTLALPGLIGPAQADQFTATERDLLLKNGVATLKVDDFGVLRVERLITTYQTNAVGAASVALLDVNTLLTLDYLRYDAFVQYSSTFPRAKLADDGNRYGTGQVVVTPKVAKAFFLVLFRGWEELGLVENFEQFEADLVVERNAIDRNRLDVLLRPDLINQLRVTGAAIQFIL